MEAPVNENRRPRPGVKRRRAPYLRLLPAALPAAAATDPAEGSASLTHDSSNGPSCLRCIGPELPEGAPRYHACSMDGPHIAGLNAETPGFGMMRPAGERAGRTSPPKRPIAAWLIRTLLRTLGRLPLGWIRGIGAAGGWLTWALPSRPQRNTRRNIAIAYPNCSPQERSRLVRRSLIEDGRMIAEHAALWTWPQQKVLQRIRHVEGAESVHRAMSEGRGVILAAAHLGSIEALCVWCATHFQMRSQYREPRIRELDPFFRHARERFGARLLPTGQGSVRLLLRGLKDGELLGIPCDQDAGEGTGIFVPFFGQLANTMTLIPRLARKSDAIVFTAFARRLPGGSGWALHFEVVDDAIRDPDLAIATSAMNEAVERCVRAHTEQYLWSYRRFRVQPPVAGVPQNEDEILRARQT